MGRDVVAPLDRLSLRRRRLSLLLSLESTGELVGVPAAAITALENGLDAVLLRYGVGAGELAMRVEQAFDRYAATATAESATLSAPVPRTTTERGQTDGQPPGDIPAFLRPGARPPSSGRSGDP